MINKEHYFDIAKKYGEFASWAVWAEEGKTPKSNISDMKIFDLDQNPKLLDLLNPDVVMVGLNFSRTIKREAFVNFHDKSPHGQDYKIRYAFRATRFYGAYMTDIIKNFEEKASGKVAAHLKLNIDFENKNIDLFKQELNDLRTKNPLIIAFGAETHNLLAKHLKDSYRIVKVPHYSMQIGKEDYREKVLGLLAAVVCT